MEGEDEARKLLDVNGDGEITLFEIISVFANSLTAETQIEKSKFWLLLNGVPLGGKQRGCVFSLSLPAGVLYAMVTALT